MKIKFLGAVSGVVTGSSYVLTSDSGKSILIDLGMFQGTPDIDKLNYDPYEYDVSKLSGAVLTHAHLDHCGRLPILMPRGFTADIWMTPETRDLTELSLFDTAKIARNNKDKPFLFDDALVEKTIAKFKTVDLHHVFKIDDFTIEMYDAGHILGSTSLKITNGQNSIIFSGDLGNSPEPLEKATEIISEGSTVIMESTYGDRLHPKGDPSEVVQSEINAIEKGGGVLLIPAFSLERTQELLHIIMHLKREGKISSVTPIYLDSPMAEKAIRIYENYPQSLNFHIQDDLKNGNPFEFTEFQDTPGPKVIIAGSGMMTGGRIVGHAAHYLPMQSTRLLIVGYQGEETLGRELLEGKKRVNIEGIDIEVKATITDIQTMSSHADQSQLINWLKNIKNVKKLFLTHGEDIARKALAEKIKEDLGLKDIILPVFSQEA
jgi:metallo-beta-lactamase family protein